jgi:hypothetical protein
MLPVLHLDPMRRSAGAIRSVPVLRNQTLESEQARVPEQVRADLTLFEWCKVAAIDTARRDFALCISKGKTSLGRSQH